MAETVADVLLARLPEWGVQQVFGLPGDAINGLLAAWGRAKDDRQFLQARHEELAAFEAAGYAKFSGMVGVCVATSGPGAIHLLNALYDKKLDHVAVVAIVGQTARSVMGGCYQQQVDLLSLFKVVCRDYAQMRTVPQQSPNPDRSGHPGRPGRARPDLRDRPVRPGVRTTCACAQAGPIERRNSLGHHDGRPAGTCRSPPTAAGHSTPTWPPPPAPTRRTVYRPRAPRTAPSHRAHQPSTTAPCARHLPPAEA